MNKENTFIMATFIAICSLAIVSNDTKGNRDITAALTRIEEALEKIEKKMNSSETKVINE